MHIDEEKTGEDTNGVKFDEAQLLSFPGLFFTRKQPQTFIAYFLAGVIELFVKKCPLSAHCMHVACIGL